MGKRGNKSVKQAMFIQNKYRSEKRCTDATPVKIIGWVLGIDPGEKGAFVLTNGIDGIDIYPMPVEPVTKAISHGGALRLFQEFRERFSELPVFLERAVSFGMGVKGAFNYGRGFEAIVIALQQANLSLTMVEPGKWAKEMHAGIDSNLKPKAKSAIAVNRLYPNLVGSLPTKPRGGLHDGVVDALLIAGYGLRKLGFGRPTEEPDFY